MTFINYATREINVKIVLAGPTGCGKAEIARRVYDSIPSSDSGKLVSLATGIEPTLFFDFNASLGSVRGFTMRFHLYTCPAEIFYERSARLILKGVDGIILIPDCSPDNRSANQACVERLRENLSSLEYRLETMPLVVLGYNPRDDEGFDATYIRELLGVDSVPMIAASSGPQAGFDSLKQVARLILTELTRPAGHDVSKEHEVTSKGRWIAVNAPGPPPVPRIPLWESSLAFLRRRFDNVPFLGAVYVSFCIALAAWIGYEVLALYIAYLLLATVVSLWIYYRNRRQEDDERAFTVLLR